MNDNLACTVVLFIASVAGFAGFLVALLAAVRQAVLG